MKRLALLGAVIAGLPWLTLAPRHAAAMTFTVVPDGEGFVIGGDGPIVIGDRVRLITAADSVGFGKAILLLLNSPGGSVLEAERLAISIRTGGFAVGVGKDSMCASACFLLFAAGEKKFVAPSAFVGVHSAAQDGSETLQTMGATTALARDAAAYGVPASIVGRMVTTEPNKMAWLGAAELQSFGVVIVPAWETPSFQQAPTSQQISQADGTAFKSSAAATAGPTAAFQQGAADRRGWEAWVSGLDADTRAGVEYWAGQRSLKVPGACSPPSGAATQNPSNWFAGCMAAKTRLGLSDNRRRSEPDYKAGWNSL